MVEHPLVFLWDNFGPLHADRCSAVTRAGFAVTGLELHGRSDTYDWNPEAGEGFAKVTLFSQGNPRGLRLLHALINYRRRNGRAIWFLCHYEWKEIFFFAIYLKLCGDRAFTMGCSKYDDKPRLPMVDWLKSWFLKPYSGAIGSGIRSRDYFRYLGLRPQNIVGEYNTVSQDRIRMLAGSPPAPDGTSFLSRHFTIVARLIPKKNIAMALHAHAIYCESVERPRPLHICGSGPLEAELRGLCDELDISSHVVFRGFVQTADVAIELSTTLALLLPSVEEQFGNVVPEAQAMNIPVILSDNCGARDLLVHSGSNGFVIDPQDSEGLAFFMQLISGDEALWRHMCEKTAKRAPLGDVSRFAEGVKLLVAMA